MAGRFPERATDGGMTGYWLFVRDTDLQVVSAAMHEMPYKLVAAVLARLAEQTERAGSSASRGLQVPPTADIE